MPILTTCDLLVKNNLNNNTMGPRSLQFSAFCRSVSWETVSNVFLRSMRVACFTLGFNSQSFRMSFMKFTKASIEEPLGLNPNRFLVKTPCFSKKSVMRLCSNFSKSLLKAC